jgi:hypothetical protein
MLSQVVASFSNSIKVFEAYPVWSILLFLLNDFQLTSVFWRKRLIIISLSVELWSIYVTFCSIFKPAHEIWSRLLLINSYLQLRMNESSSYASQSLKLNRFAKNINSVTIWGQLRLSSVMNFAMKFRFSYWLVLTINQNDQNYVNNKLRAEPQLTELSDELNILSFITYFYSNQLFPELSLHANQPTAHSQLNETLFEHRLYTIAMRWSIERQEVNLSNNLVQLNSLSVVCYELWCFRVCKQNTAQTDFDASRFTWTTIFIHSEC